MPEISAFLAALGLEAAALSPVAADWSVRRFHRVVRDGHSAILMRWPDGTPGGEIGRLPEITALFAAHGVRVPQVYAVDAAAGFALVEDFGPLTMAQRIDAGEPAAPMLHAAVDLLVHLHKAYPAVAGHDLPRFTAAMAAERAARFCDWALPALAPDARARFIALWRLTWPMAEAVPITLAHYDFHPGNMFSITAGKCAVIDFQDAVLAPVAFDLACLLQDIRRDYDPGLLADLRARYLGAFPGLDPELLDQAVAVTGAQRATQILGNLGRARAEGRLSSRQAGDIARAWDRLERNLGHPVLAGLKPWYDTHAPAESRPRQANAPSVTAESTG